MSVIKDPNYRCPKCGRGVDLKPFGKWYDVAGDLAENMYVPLCSIHSEIPWFDDQTGEFRCWGDLCDSGPRA